MAIGMGILGNAATKHKPQKQDAARVKTGIGKLSESIAADIKQEDLQVSALPKDWRGRILR
jgi:hypothetical protein